MRGLNHTKRRMARKKFDSQSDLNNAVRDLQVRQSYVERTRDREAQSLSEMYLESPAETHRLPYDLGEDLDDAYWKILIKERQMLSATALKNSSMQEEQEREVAHEVEQEREIQRPPRVQACKHNPVDPVLREFVRTGKSAPKLYRDDCKRAFDSLKKTTAAPLMEPNPICNLYVTQDFAQTVVLTKGDHMDNYIRPVHWVLVSLVDDKMSALIIR